MAAEGKLLLLHASPRANRTAPAPTATAVQDASSATLSNAEISGALVIAEQTTKTHVGRILAKLNLRDRAQAVVFAYETGLVNPGE